jgi:glycine/D-amino acid oxidase-like deaminating enzyme
MPLSVPLSEPLPQNRILIIGAGIVGSALAYHLSLSSSPHSTTTTSTYPSNITLLDSSFPSRTNSTSHAPGFVGQYNQSPTLTTLAKASVSEYLSIPGGFDLCGGLEVSGTASGVERLRTRCTAAKEMGLEAEMLSQDEVLDLAGDGAGAEGDREKGLVKTEDVLAGLYFPGDGAADAKVITRFYLQKVRENGVVFIEGKVTGLLVTTDSNSESPKPKKITAVNTTAGLLQAERVILCTGIWTSPLLSSISTPFISIPPIPIVPVAHPYTYGTVRPPRTKKLPWIRWPDQHVYARDHGISDGFGSYNHYPIDATTDLKEGDTDTAIGAWPTTFDETLERARKLLPAGKSMGTEEKFNGIFAMTPDGLPLAGKVDGVEGLYMAAAVWVTQAAGTGKFMADLLRGGGVEEKVRMALDPNRFKDGEIGELREEALRGYRDVYETTEG